MRTKDQMVESLGGQAAMATMKGAVQYLRAHKLAANLDALTDACRSWAKVKLPEALADAKEAVACNMGQIAVATFVAGMAQAGIEAAKGCGYPAGSDLAREAGAEFAP